MAGSYAQFKSLIERLTEESGRNPDAYRRKVLLLAVLGYGLRGSAKADAAFAEALAEIGLGERMLGIVLEKSEFAPLKRRIRKLPGALVYKA